MGSLTGFLFNGTPPQSTTTYGQTVKDMPKWLSDYTQGLISKANTIAAEPYQAYQGPRIAGLTPEQKQAFDVTKQNVGSWQPGMDAASTYTSQAGAMSPLQQAAPYMQQASRTFPEAVGEYMDPYVGNVIDRAKLEANRNYSENIMPGLDSKFIRNGQYGSSAHEREADRAARDLTEGVNSQSLAALSGAYQSAGSLFGADASRAGNLANTAGTLANDEAQNKLAAGAQSGQLAQLLQSLGIKDAAGLEAIGATQQNQNQKNLDLAYSDFKEQRDNPKKQLDWMSSIVRGLPTPSSTTTTETGPGAGAAGPSGLNQIGALLTAIGGYNEASKPGGNARGGYIDGYAEGGKVVEFQKGASLLARRLHNFFKGKASQEKVPYDLDPSFFQEHLDNGVRKFFGVHVDDLQGDVKPKDKLARGGYITSGDYYG